MPSLSPITPNMLALIVIFMLIFADLVITNLQLAQAKEEDDCEKSNKLKKSLSEKMNLTIIALTVVFITQTVKFVIFLVGHFHRVS